MGVDDGLHIESLAIDGEMHADFAGDFSGAGDLTAVEIDDDHVAGLQEVLAGAGGCGEQTIVAEANGEVARGAGHEAEFMQPSAETDKFPSQLTFAFPYGVDQGYAPLSIPRTDSIRINALSVIPLRRPALKYCAEGGRSGCGVTGEEDRLGQHGVDAYVAIDELSDIDVDAGEHVRVVAGEVFSSTRRRIMSLTAISVASLRSGLKPMVIPEYVARAKQESGLGWGYFAARIRSCRHADDFSNTAPPPLSLFLPRRLSRRRRRTQPRGRP